MFKVLITGAQGQVGSELIKSAPGSMTPIGLGSNELDICQPHQISAAIAQHQPNLIINAAAYTAVDAAQSNSDAAFAVNAQGVQWLAQAAKAVNIPVFHLSTDYVFDGQAQQPYTETDLPNPGNVYGASKLAGEYALIHTHHKHIIVRTSWVFGSTGQNFVKTILRLATQHAELSVVADQYGCPTSAHSIAQALWQLAQRYATDGHLAWGLYHFSNGPDCTWHHFADHILTQALTQGLLDKKPVIQAITTEQYPTAAPRPAWSVLSNQKIEHLLQTQPIQWQDQLSELLAHPIDLSQ